MIFFAFTFVLICIEIYTYMQIILFYSIKKKTLKNGIPTLENNRGYVLRIGKTLVLPVTLITVQKSLL